MYRLYTVEQLEVYRRAIDNTRRSHRDFTVSEVDKITKNGRNLVFLTDCNDSLRSHGQNIYAREWGADMIVIKEFHW